MNLLIMIEVGGSLLPSLLFAVLFGRPWVKRDRATAWMVASWVWAAIAWETTLLAAVMGVRIPTWLAPVVLGGPLVVSWWRLIAFLRERPGKP